MSENYVIGLIAEFEAAHHLRNYRGACERVHGHTWRIEVRIQCDLLPDKGYGVDFNEAQNQLKRLTERLDHNHINDLFPFTEIEPTSEHLARWFYIELHDALKKSGGEIESVRVWEGPWNYAEYRREEDALK